VVCPADAPHGCSLLVIGANGRLHLPLSLFANAAVRRLSPASARAYLAAVLPFVSRIEDASPLRCDDHGWDAAPSIIRRVVTHYLNDRFACQIREHRLGFQLVRRTARTPAGVALFLSALKLFYRVMREEDLYPCENPLVDQNSLVMASVADPALTSEDGPRMPDWSGVVAPRARRRLSDSYFKLQGSEWVPRIVDDPTLPAQVLAAGQTMGWRLREICVARLLFESGARISEVAGLTLGDWQARGLRQETSAFSKGSFGRCIKFLRFSTTTAKLLRRYFDGERRGHDLNHRRLAGYAELGSQGRLDLFEVPLFLSRQGTSLSPDHFRDHYWRPACMAAGLDVDVHQARHWYVTMAVRHIYETARDEGVLRRQLRELIEYMQWRRGWETLQAYDHYFDAARHAEIQDALHQRLEQSLSAALTASRDRRRLADAPPAPADPTVATLTAPADPELAFLEGLLR
jgi:site-specific recombinase XerC